MSVETVDVVCDQSVLAVSGRSEPKIVEVLGWMQIVGMGPLYPTPSNPPSKGSPLRMLELIVDLDDLLQRLASDV